MHSRGDHDNESQSESVTPSEVNPYYNHPSEEWRLHAEYDEHEVGKASKSLRIDGSADRGLKSNKGKSIQYASP